MHLEVLMKLPQDFAVAIFSPPLTGMYIIPTEAVLQMST